MRIAGVAAMLALTAGFGRAADVDRAPTEALKHYRAGQAALQTERFEDAETEFRAAIEAGLAAGGGALRARPDDDGNEALPRRRRRPSSRPARPSRGASSSRRATRWSTQRRLDDQIKALQDDINAARARASGSNASAIQSAIMRNEDQIKTLQSMRKRGGEGPMPTPHWLSFALGSAYFRAGDLANAEKEYRAALTEKPDLGEGHLNLGVVLMLTGRLDDADREVALAEKAGVKVPQGLKDDIQKRRQAQPKP